MCIFSLDFSAYKGYSYVTFISLNRRRIGDKCSSIGHTLLISTGM